MAASIALATSLLFGAAAAQSLGTSPEVHPKVTTYKCTTAGGCTPQNSALVLDSASHWIHQKNDTTKGCGNWGSAADPTACPDVETCAKNCIMEGVSDYTQNGVKTQNSSITLDIYGPSGNEASPRIYLLDPSEKKYELFQLLNQEFTFDVDVSKLPCGMNGALYMSEMDPTGGQSTLNPGGAAYGTGYCDAQCYTTPWVNGVGNVNGSGICCNELDIWEANRAATQLAPHTCSNPGIYQCTGTECGSTGVCDKNGCANNPWGLGDKTYYGPGLKIDTTKPFSVVTQFPATNGTLTHIVRKYVQNGVVYENAMLNATGIMDDAYCTAHGATAFMKTGAMAGMGGSLTRGMVLALSIWWDAGGNMNWLDSGSAGPCNATEGNPTNITQVEKAPTVTFSQIKWGDIGSTFKSNSTMRRLI